jgi:hypothetical protein
MSPKTTSKLAAALLMGGALVAVGCDRPVAAPSTNTSHIVNKPVIDPIVDEPIVTDRAPPTDVNVDVRNGRGIHVNVDKEPGAVGPLGRPQKDVDVQIGGGQGIRVDVEK